MLVVRVGESKAGTDTEGMKDYCLALLVVLVVGESVWDVGVRSAAVGED